MTCPLKPQAHLNHKENKETKTFIYNFHLSAYIFSEAKNFISMGSAFRSGIMHTQNKCVRGVGINYNHGKTVIETGCLGQNHEMNEIGL